MLLAGACERSTSGTFTFRHDGTTDHLTLRRGRIAVVRTRNSPFHLGTLLYELANVDLTVLNATLRDAESTGELHGEVLIRSGALQRADIEAALAEQTFRKAKALFDLPDTTIWSFREDVDELLGARDEDRPSISTWQAIWRGLRDRFASEHVRKTLAKIDTGVRLRDVAALDQFGLDAAERDVGQRLFEKPAALDAIMGASSLSVERTEMLVYVFALARCITRVEVQPVGPTELGIQGIRERAQLIATQDPRKALGVRDGQSSEAIRANYFRLARLWHPERLPAHLAEVRSECEFVFVKLVEAHRALTDSDAASKRPTDATGDAAGPQSIGPAGGFSIAPSSSFEPTRASMRDVDAALARGDFASAEALARTLLNGGGDGPGARAVLAWCLATGGVSSPESALERALAALDKVLLADPDCVRALHYRAQLELRLGLLDAALRDYRKVLRLDPRHEDAQRELALHEAPGRPASFRPRGLSLVPKPANARTSVAPTGMARGSVPPGVHLQLAPRIREK